MQIEYLGFPYVEGESPSREYVIEASLLDLKDREYKEFLLQDVNGFLPYSNNVAVKVEQIGIGLLLESLALDNKYILIDKKWGIAVILKDHSGWIRKISNNAIERIVRKLLKLGLTVQKIEVMYPLSHYYFYYQAENIPDDTELKFDVRGKRFDLPISFYEEFAVVTAEDFNSFVRFIVYNTFNEHK